MGIEHLCVDGGSTKKRLYIWLIYLKDPKSLIYQNHNGNCPAKSICLRIAAMGDTLFPNGDATGQGRQERVALGVPQSFLSVWHACAFFGPMLAASQSILQLEPR